ncbi:unnamed protein product [Closterium sp. NIES-64]|nr:unnamed protein product [Closterium sp. NIES-65]CAI5958775.1 unnamed protein product [Closterium sp. NIES-65]CAI5974893.1 unnamed protein product [Closterium sp. NIES-64]
MAALRAAFLGVLVAAVGSFVYNDPLALRQPVDVSPVPLPPRAVPAASDPSNRLASAEIKYLHEGIGPESLAVDTSGRGPYSGLADGRVVRRSADGSQWVPFAQASPNRTPQLCDILPKSHPDPSKEPLCGRPLGLRFHPVTGELYIADAYYGLNRVGLKGGLAEQLVGGKSVDGQKVSFVNDLDIDAEDANGTVYFTVTSTKYEMRNFLSMILDGGANGGVYKYDVATGEVTQLVAGVAFANGIALSADRSFLVYCETIRARCNRYWLTGSKAGSHEVMVDLPGVPDNPRLNPRGRFWIAMPAYRTSAYDFLARTPRLRSILLRLHLHPLLLYAGIFGLPNGVIAEVDSSGQITEILEDRAGKRVQAPSEVMERDGKLWIASLIVPHLAVLDYSPGGSTSATA